jgi:hypothetical protein
MKVGDKKKATILSIVAVGALAFFIIRMLPEPGRKASAASAGATAPAASAPAPTATTVALVNDPFSHADLAEKKPKLLDGQGPKTDDPSKKLSVPKGDDPVPPYGRDWIDRAAKGVLSGSLPGVDGKGVGVQAEGSNDTKAGGDKKDDKAGEKKPELPKITLSLSAVLSAGKSTAFIAVGDGEPSAFEVGQTISDNPKYRVIEIGSDRVIVAGAGKTKTLRVGEKAEL